MFCASCATRRQLWRVRKNTHAKGIYCHKTNSARAYSSHTHRVTAPSQKQGTRWSPCEITGSHLLPIGDARRLGLFLGVELVRNRETLEPTVEEAAAPVVFAKHRGGLLGVDGPLRNVLTIKPPLPFIYSLTPTQRGWPRVEGNCNRFKLRGTKSDRQIWRLETGKMPFLTPIYGGRPTFYPS